MNNDRVSEEVWAAKDRLNSYMSALKAASTNNTGLGKSSEDILTEANKYYGRLLQAKIDKVTDTTVTIPLPTPKQKEILVEVANKKLEWTEQYVTECVYKWKGQFPTNPDSVQQIVDYLKG